MNKINQKIKLLCLLFFKMLPEECLVPIVLPRHPCKDIEAIFSRVRKCYSLNIHSALEGDFSRLVFSHKTGKYIRMEEEMSSFYLRSGEFRKKIKAHWLIMLTCHPNETPRDVWVGKICRKGHRFFSKWTIDHINGIHNDNRVENLRWLTRSDHAKLSKGKKLKSERKVHSTKNLLVGEREMYKSNNIFEKLSKKYGCPSLAFLRVTNKGRVKIKGGKYTRGYLRYINKHNDSGEVVRHRETRYRRVKIDHLEYSVHVLIMTAKLNREIPKGFVVMHNDAIPTSVRLDEEGAERNWIGDLKIGSESDNSRGYYDNLK